jgi:hypothetical protein
MSVIPYSSRPVWTTWQDPISKNKTKEETICVNLSDSKDINNKHLALNLME